MSLRVSNNHESHESQSHNHSESTAHHPTLTPSQFASILEEIRPALLGWAASRRQGSVDEAEDIVGQATHLALLILPEFDASTGSEGLRRWMTGIVRCVILTERQKAARRPKTVPIEPAITPSAAPTEPARPTLLALKATLSVLPAFLASLVWDWFAGYSQTEIADLHKIHRNTVAYRLELAFETLRIACPDADELTYSGALLHFCSRVPIYRKPKAPWRSWVRNHPPDIRIALQPVISNDAPPPL